MADISLLIDVQDQSVVKAVDRVNRLEGQYRKLDKAFNTGKITAQQYAKGIKQIDTQMDAVRASTGKLAGSTNRFVKDMQRSAVAMNQFGELADRGTRQFKRFGAVGLQQVGYQVGDFAVQIQGGTNAAVAFGQQGSQLLGIFGPLGAVLGAVLAIVTAFAAPMLDSAKAGGQMAEEFSKVGDQLQTLEPLLTSIRNGINAMKEVSIDLANVLLNNLDRVVVYIGTAAALFGGKFVAGIVAARVATISLAGAFAFLKGAIMRTGIGLAVVAVGELVYWFTRLVKGAGSVGDAFDLLKGVAQEVFQKKIVGFFQVMQIKAAASWLRLKGSALSAMSGVMDWLGGTFVNKTVGLFVGVKDAAVAAWGVLPDALMNIGARAVNGLIDKVATGVKNLVTGPMAPLLRLAGLNPAAMGLGAEAIGGLKVDIPEPAGMGDAISGAFSSAMGQNYFEGFGESFGRGASQALKDADIISGTADVLSEFYNRPLESIQDLRDAMAQAESEGIDLRDILANLGAGTSEEGAGGAGASAADNIRELNKQLSKSEQIMLDVGKTVSESFGDALMSIVDGSKSAADAFKDMARAILKQAYELLVIKPLMNSLFGESGGGGIIGSLVSGFTGAEAKGGVYGQSGKITAYANGGVVSGAQMFTHKGGYGVMGEAGPEAIMPLKRGKNGKLGVQAEGGQQTVVINQAFNFSANGDDSVKRIIRQEAPKIASYTQQQILDQRRRGGAIKQTFG